MAIQQTLIIVKPDGLAKGLVGRIFCDIKSNNLSVIDHARIKLDRAWVEELYAGGEQEVYFEEVVNWISSAPVLFLRIQGEQAIEKAKWRIIGRYPEGIRGRYSENWIKNVAHASDSEESAEREIKLSESIFEKSKRMDEDLFRGKTVFALTGMSECGKSTVGRYLDLRGIPRLKIVRLFEQVRSKQAPGDELYQFIKKGEERDPYALWDSFVNELLAEMDVQKVSIASIESLYGGGLGPYLKHRIGDRFCIIYIDIPLGIRLQRQMQRGGLTNIEEAKDILLPRDKVKANSGIPALKEIADEVIDNSGTIEDLYWAIDKIIARHK